MTNHLWRWQTDQRADGRIAGRGSRLARRLE
jgi:hypothetical protein